MVRIKCIGDCFYISASSGEVNICDSQAAQVITVPGTTIISPNHPGDYQNNLDCQVSIQLSERVRIRFEAFNVESHTSCRYDYLEVRDGDSSSSSMIGSKLCGDLIPDAIESTGSSMTLVFHTDSSAIRTGFRIVVELGKNRLGKKEFKYFHLINPKNVSFILKFLINTSNWGIDDIHATFCW